MSLKFCTSCQKTKPTEGGYMKPIRHATRWVCKDCKDRISRSPYKSKGKKLSDTSQIRKQLIERN